MFYPLAALEQRSCGGGGGVVVVVVVVVVVLVLAVLVIVTNGNGITNAPCSMTNNDPFRTQRSHKLKNALH
jgi:preprotein translocase subunit SecG